MYLDNTNHIQVHHLLCQHTLKRSSTRDTGLRHKIPFLEIQSPENTIPRGLEYWRHAPRQSQYDLRKQGSKHLLQPHLQTLDQNASCSKRTPKATSFSPRPAPAPAFLAQLPSNRQNRSRSTYPRPNTLFPHTAARHAPRLIPSPCIASVNKQPVAHSMNRNETAPISIRTRRSPSVDVDRCVNKKTPRSVLIAKDEMKMEMRMKYHF